jgi:hypothetical protein
MQKPGADATRRPPACGITQGRSASRTWVRAVPWASRLSQRCEHTQFEASTTARFGNAECDAPPDWALRRPCRALQPATRAQFGLGASNWIDTPFLQATTYEHEHEHRTPNAKRLVSVPPMIVHLPGLRQHQGDKRHGPIPSHWNF